MMWHLQAPWVGKSPEDEEHNEVDFLDSDASYNDRPLGWDEPDAQRESEEQKGDTQNA